VDVQLIVELAMIVLVVVGAVTIVTLGIPRLRRTVVPPVKQAIDSIWTVLRNPKRVALLFAGFATAALLYGWCLLACIEAFGGSLSFWTVLAANILVSNLASLIPIPGGSTAVSAVGLSGILVAAGVPNPVAVAAVLANQVVVTFLPAIPGWWATNRMLRAGYL
jgi:uncharacterized membrane protein YbhN (UPF0104 family)